MDNDIPMLAAILLTESAATASLMETIVPILGAEGWRVAGYIQSEIAADHLCCPDMVVADVETGERFRISQSLGPGSKGCRLDTQMLAEISGRASVRLDGAADLVVLNRFGKSEAEGGGLRAVFEKALSRNIPVLTCVKPDYHKAFADYAGLLGVSLLATEDAVLTWCRAVLGSRRHTQHAG